LTVTPFSTPRETVTPQLGAASASLSKNPVNFPHSQDRHDSCTQQQAYLGGVSSCSGGLNRDVEAAAAADETQRGAGGATSLQVTTKRLTQCVDPRHNFSLTSMESSNQQEPAGLSLSDSTKLATDHVPSSSGPPRTLTSQKAWRGGG
jgi:hypothetical protein